MVAYCTGSDPIEIGDLGSKVKITVTQYPFFLHNSLLTSLLEFSALLCPIESNTYAYSRFAFNFDINYIKFVMMSLWRYSSFLQTIVYVSNFNEPTDFIHGTNIHYKVHLVIRVQVTLTDAEGHRWKSKVTKVLH